MPDFYMLAGTVSTEKKLNEIAKLLISSDLKLAIVDDEIELYSDTNLTFRSGFGHEYIVVADATDKTVLKKDVSLLSDILKKNQITHEFEFYDMTNELYDVIEYSAD